MRVRPCRASAASAVAMRAGLADRVPVSEGAVMGWRVCPISSAGRLARPVRW